MSEFANLKIHRPVRHLADSLDLLRSKLDVRGYAAPQVKVAGIDISATVLDSTLLGRGEFRVIQDQVGRISHEERDDIVDYLQESIPESWLTPLSISTHPLDSDSAPRYPNVYGIAAGNDGQLLDERDEVQELLQDYFAETGRHRFSLLENDRFAFAQIISVKEENIGVMTEQICDFLRRRPALLPAEIIYSAVEFSDE